MEHFGPLQPLNSPSSPTLWMDHPSIKGRLNQATYGGTSATVMIVSKMHKKLISSSKPRENGSLSRERRKLISKNDGNDMKQEILR